MSIPLGNYNSCRRSLEKTVVLCGGQRPPSAERTISDICLPQMAKAFLAIVQPAMYSSRFSVATSTTPAPPSAWMKRTLCHPLPELTDAIIGGKSKNGELRAVILLGRYPRGVDAAGFLRVCSLPYRALWR
jgi:hypothetical protein